MRWVRMPSAVSTAIDVLLWAALVVGSLRVLWAMWGWVGPVVGSVVVLLGWLLGPLPVADDEPCRRCDHLGVHHHGPCQACLRDQRDGHLAIAVPCGRFRRSSPRTRAERLRRAWLP